MSDMVLMYGGFPPSDASPRITPEATPGPAAPLPIPALGLLPCPKCNRHIHVGTVCPFCFAAELAAANKPPTRAAVDQALREARDVLIEVDSALARIHGARKQICAVVQALEEATK